MTSADGTIMLVDNVSADTMALFTIRERDDGTTDGAVLIDTDDGTEAWLNRCMPDRGSPWKASRTQLHRIVRRELADLFVEIGDSLIGSAVGLIERISSVLGDLTR